MVQRRPTCAETTSVDIAFYNVGIQHNEVGKTNWPGKVANLQEDVRS